MSLGQTAFDTDFAKRQEASVFCGNYHPLSGPTQPSPTFQHSSTPDAPEVRGGALQMESKRGPLAQSIAGSSNRKNGLECFTSPRILKEPIKESFMEDLPER